MYKVLVKPTYVCTLKVRRSTGLLEKTTAAVMRAHELFAALAEDEGRFANLFLPQDGSDVSRFWDNVFC